MRGWVGAGEMINFVFVEMPGKLKCEAGTQAGDVGWGVLEVTDEQRNISGGVCNRKIGSESKA